jgi:hypothetical protein
MAHQFPPRHAFGADCKRRGHGFARQLRAGGLLSFVKGLRVHAAIFFRSPAQGHANANELFGTVRKGA